MAIQRLLNQTVNRCIHTQAALHKTHKWAFVWIDDSHRGRDYNNTLTPKHNQVCLQPHLDVADKTLHQRFYFILFFKENENLPNFIESVSSFCLVAQFGNLNLSGLCGIIKTTGKISASQQAGLLSTYKRYRSWARQMLFGIVLIIHSKMSLSFCPQAVDLGFRWGGQKSSRVHLSQVQFIYLMATRS